MPTARNLHTGRRLTVLAGTRVVAVLAPGRWIGRGPVPARRDQAIEVRRDRAFALREGDLVAGTVVWLIDPDTWGEGEEPGTFFARPAVIE